MNTPKLRKLRHKVKSGNQTPSPAHKAPEPKAHEGKESRPLRNNLIKPLPVTCRGTVGVEALCLSGV